MSSKTAIHQVLTDLQRVQSEIGHVPSRNEYKKLGKFSTIQIIEMFGSYQRLLQAAGANYQRGKLSKDESTYEKSLESYDKKKLIHARFEKEIAPFHGKFDRLNKDVFLVASISDSHSQFWDEFTWRVFIEFCKEARPDLIVLGGDNLEFYTISRHNQNPRRAFDLQDEIDFVVKNKLWALRLACPRAQIDYHLGNHEARLFTYLCGNAPALSSLRALQFDKLLALDDLGINLIGRESFVFKTKMEDNYKVYRGLWAWTHGTDCTQFPAHKELARHGVSGASGHVHRHTAYAKRDVFGFKTWMSLGASCSLKTGHEYIPSLINWETGFLLSFVHPKGVNQQHISTEGGFACVGGTFFRNDAHLSVNSSK